MVIKLIPRGNKLELVYAFFAVALHVSQHLPLLGYHNTFLTSLSLGLSSLCVTGTACQCQLRGKRGEME